MPKVSNIIAEHLKNAALPKFVESPTAFVHQQRIIKSAAEQQLMRHTCAIASQAINATMRETKPGDSEHHVFARVDYKCRMAGASFLAYPPVVASGRNATVIHYVQNSQRIADGDMILMDAGCEYGGYSSDITRTWPVTGRFNDAQRVLYEVVWLLQRELIATINRDGGRTLDELFDTMCLRLGQLLQEAGLLRRTLAGQDLARAAFRLCPHHVSHYLGMDVHDTPMISRQMPLRPGVVCTVEPGIYIGDDITDVPPEFRGLGIRIEDDVLILDEGEVEVLTDACVKDPAELETLVASV